MAGYSKRRTSLVDNLLSELQTEEGQKRFLKGAAIGLAAYYLYNQLNKK